MKQYFILEATAFERGGRKHKRSVLFYGTEEQARASAGKLRAELESKNLSAHRVAVFSVDEMTYRGSIRG